MFSNENERNSFPAFPAGGELVFCGESEGGGDMRGVPAGKKSGEKVPTPRGSGGGSPPSVTTLVLTKEGAAFALFLGKVDFMEYKASNAGKILAKKGMPLLSPSSLTDVMMQHYKF